MQHTSPASTSYTSDGGAATLLNYRQSSATTCFFSEDYVQRSREILVDSQVGLVALEELALDQRLDPLLDHARVGQEARFELLRHLRVRKARSRRRADAGARV